MNTRKYYTLLNSLLLIYFVFTIQSSSQSISTNAIGIFSESLDIGNVALKGTTIFTKFDSSYKISGSGENMWFEEDAFHYAWLKVNGDVSLSAEIKWTGKGLNPHRKAGLIIRQNLNKGSKCTNAMLHGDGLMSLQYREEEDSLTFEIQSNIVFPQRIELSKIDNYVFISLAGVQEDLKFSGSNYRIEYEEPFYIGLGVCSHDNSTLETALFSNVQLKKIAKDKDNITMLHSTLETVDIESKNRRVIYSVKDHIEAPNWSRDGRFFIYNSRGLLYKIPLEGGVPQIINSGFAQNCNNDHGISPDGKTIVISDQSGEDNKSRIYTLPIEGGEPELVTESGPSYWHGWSPDGKTLAYCAERNGEYDIYSISVDGGEEKRLTNSEGLDDGPDYSPDGKYIFFNSVRTGMMQIWRMKRDGSEQTQITFDDFNDWFPHPSPDGKWLVFLSYESDVVGHPANKDVLLRIMSLETNEIEVLAKLFGGQGTINVPSWSPDSKNIAFVSYKLLAE